MMPWFPSERSLVAALKLFQSQIYKITYLKGGKGDRFIFLFFGGRGFEWGNGIAVDSTGNTY